MSKKIKLLFDITVLGEGHTNPSSRTGIFRVVENLAIQFNAHPAIDFYYCCDNKLYSLLNCHNYIKASTGFSAKKFIVPSKKASMIKAMMSLHDLLSFSSGQPKKNHFNRNLERIRFVCISFFQKILFSKNQFEKNELLEFDVYHNLFVNLPANVNELGIKSVFVTVHDMIPLLYPEFCHDAIIKLFKKHMNGIDRSIWVSCDSFSTKNDLLRLMGSSIDPKRVSVVHLAASDHFYVSADPVHNREILDRYHISNKKYVLSLCTVEKRKNLKKVIEVFSRLIDDEQIADLDLVLVGTTGVEFQQIFSTIYLNPKLKDRIIITGYLPDEDLAAIYSQALMFVYPSFYEGFGLPPLEAMQCGVPVITSNTSSVPEVVGDAGILIDPNDQETLYDAILRMYLDEGLRVNYVKRGLERAKHFSWSKCAEQTIDMYKMSLNDYEFS